ncbi:hypothetical protein [Nisaea sp.]|uniref:hypothetical protein n=1 Tax=Nisaea sp. TaxID=2024842 RepID=UPI003B521C3B
MTSSTRGHVVRIVSTALMSVSLIIPAGDTDAVDVFYGENKYEIVDQAKYFESRDIASPIISMIFGDSSLNRFYHNITNVILDSEDNKIRFKIIGNTDKYSDRYNTIGSFISDLNEIVSVDFVLNGTSSTNIENNRDADVNFFTVHKDMIVYLMNRLEKNTFSNVIHDWNDDGKCITVLVLSKKMRVIRAYNFIDNSVSDEYFYFCAKNSVFESLYFPGFTTIDRGRAAGSGLIWNGRLTYFDMVGFNFVYSLEEKIRKTPTPDRKVIEQKIRQSVEFIINCMDRDFVECGK